MLLPQPLLVTGGLLCYAAAGIYLLRHLLGESRPSAPVVHTLTAFALLLHTGLLHDRLSMPNGLNFNLSSVASITSWIMMLFTWLTSFYRPTLGLLCLAIPVAMLGMSAGQIPSSYSSVLASPRLGVDLHILFSILAYSLLSMAAAQSVLLLILQKELKHRVPSRKWTIFLPPLQEMEGLLFDLLKIGFGLLTVALVLGAVYVENLFTQHLVHKTVLSITGWLLFGWLLAGHLFAGWRGARAVRFTLAGFGLLVLGFLGSKVVLELILQRAI